MNDDHRETEFHDHAASQAVERLISTWDPQQDPVGDETDRAMRQHMAALAALAYELEPASPAASIKERLLATLAAAQTTGSGTHGMSAPVNTSFPQPVDRTLQHDAERARDPRDQTFVGAIGTDDAPLGAGAHSVVPMDRASRKTSWAPLALAAALAMCLIGLGYLYGQVTTQQSIIANQDQQLVGLAHLADELDEARGEVATLHERLAMVNTVAREAYPMRSVSTRPASTGSTDPYGRVYVCGAHQQWYLTVSGLEPAPAEQEYHLWFITDDGPVDAGVVEVKGGAAGLRDLTMPEHTSGFSVTLEAAGGGDTPRGRTVLIGDSSVKL